MDNFTYILKRVEENEAEYRALITGNGHNLRIQAGIHAPVGAGAGFPTQVNIPLNFAWSAEHIAFLYGITGPTNAPLVMKAALPGGLTEGIVIFETSFTENVQVNWVSLGR